MREEESQNKEIIKEIVLSHFGLDQESKKRFEEALEDPTPYIDEVYAPILGEDLRARFPVNRMLLEKVDTSWELFKDSFRTYCAQFSPSYVDFVQGRIRHNKNILRIFKHLPIFYFEDEKSLSALKLDFGFMFDTTPRRLRESFDARISEIIENRLPAKSDYEIVISRNFADFFLCSTGESWSSCLNLESEWSGAYWSGLPGFIIDKNKAMIYITDGDKKDYAGIVTDKFITRSFLTVTNKNKIRALRWYPSSSFFNSNVFKGLPFELEMFNPYDEQVKHGVRPLFFKNGWSCFAYQDKTSFKYSSGEVSLTEPRRLVGVEKGGQFYVHRDDTTQYHEGPYFFWEQGLAGLMEQDTDISEKKGETCCRCESLAEGDNRFVVDGEIYCERCYNESYGYCEGCDTDVPIDNMYSTDDGMYCENCYNEYYVSCERCGRAIPRDNVEEGETPICNHCINRDASRMTAEYLYSITTGTNNTWNETAST